MVQPGSIKSGMLYVGLENILSGGELDAIATVESGDLQSAKFSFSREHILYGKLRPYLAKIVAPDFSGVCSTEIVPLRPGPNMDRRFLLQFLRQPSQIALADARSTGANLPRLSPTELAKFVIPVPPLAEQRRIAAILDQADAVRAKHREVVAQLGALGSALFLEIFGDPLGNPKGWRKKRMGEVGEVITGNTPSRKNDAHYGQGIEWIKSDNINTGAYYATTALERLSPSGRSAARVTPANSILVTCIAGSPNSIGNAAMLDREAAFNQQINAVVPNACNPHFLYAQLRVGKKMVQEMSTEGMKGLVSKSRFEQIKVIVPPPALQAEFAERILLLERIRHVSSEGVKVADSLFASLQHRAFRGEL